jgi:hypothetical protein
MRLAYRFGTYGGFSTRGVVHKTNSTRNTKKHGEITDEDKIMFDHCVASILDLEVSI